MNINREFIKSNNCYKGQNNPVFLVNHETDNYKEGLNARTYAKSHYRGKFRRNSVHFYVDDKEIYQCLEYYDGAITLEDGNGRSGITDCNSINIMLCVNSDGNFEETIKNAAWLNKFLLKRFGWGMDRVKRHYDATGKMCPKILMSNPKLWQKFLKKIVGQAIYSCIEEDCDKTLVKFNAEVEELQKEINNEGLGIIKEDGIVDYETLSRCPIITMNDKGNIVNLLQKFLKSKGYHIKEEGVFGKTTLKAIIDIQKSNNLDIDGVVTYKTWNVILQS